jgi:archaetidylinositol phosphate synthase
MQNPGFQEAQRAQMSLLAPIEKRVLVWLAERAPAWIQPDHLTALGLLSLAGAGLCYWWASRNPMALVGVVVCLAVNWLGDSLDGTLARVRARQRPRYGFYVDHVVDAVGTSCLMAGMSRSGYMDESLGLYLLILYLVVSIEVYLATYTLGTFHLSFGKFSPTELRILLAAGCLIALVRPNVRLFGETYRLFDVGGAVALAVLAGALTTSVARHTAALYRAERLP